MARGARRWRAAAAVAAAAVLGLLGLYAAALAGADMLGLARAAFARKAGQSPDVTARVEGVARRLAAADDGTGFYVKLDGADLSALALTFLNRDYLRKLDVTILQDSVAFRGRLDDWLGVPAAGRMAVYLESGMVQVEVAEIAIGYVPMPGSLLSGVQQRLGGTLDLSRPGENSITLKEGQLRQALAEMARRRDDGNPATRVGVLTLDLGSSDLLGHIGSADCQSAPQGQACQTRVEGALVAFEANFREAVAALAAALEPGTEFYVLTLSNPYDLGGATPFELLSSRAVARLNAFIREVAEAEGAIVADASSGIRGHAAEWTHVLDGSIYPNALGYQAIAYSLVQARERAQALETRTDTVERRYPPHLVAPQ